MAAPNGTTTRGPKVPSYRLHKPSGMAVVRLDGRDIYLGPYGADESHDAYRRAIAEWCVQGFAGGAKRAEIIVNQLILAYWRHVEVYYVKRGAPTSEQNIIRLSLRPLRRLYGQSPVDQFGPLELKAIRQTLIERELARTTINKYISRIVGCFRWGVEEGIVPPTTLEGLRAVRGLRLGRSAARETEPVRPVEMEALEATKPHLPATVWDMIQVQLLTGMRPGELCAMTTNSLDRSDEIWLYHPKDHKTAHHGKSRVIPIGPRAQAILAPHLRTTLDVPVFRPLVRRPFRWGPACDNTSSSSTPRRIDESGKPSPKACLRTSGFQAPATDIVLETCSPAFCSS